MIGIRPEIEAAKKKQDSSQKPATEPVLDRPKDTSPTPQGGAQEKPGTPQSDKPSDQPQESNDDSTESKMDEQADDDSGEVAEVGGEDETPQAEQDEQAKEDAIRWAKKGGGDVMAWVSGTALDQAVIDSQPEPTPVKGRTVPVLPTQPVLDKDGNPILDSKGNMMDERGKPIVAPDPNNPMTPVDGTNGQAGPDGQPIDNPAVDGKVKLGPDGKPILPTDQNAKDAPPEGGKMPMDTNALKGGKVAENAPMGQGMPSGMGDKGQMMGKPPVTGKKPNPFQKGGAVQAGKKPNPFQKGVQSKPGQVQGKKPNPFAKKDGKKKPFPFKRGRK